MAEEVVDGLESIQVEEQRRNRTRLTGREAAFEVGDQCPAVVEAGQVVVLSQVLEPVLRDDARLQLREQGRDHLQRVQLVDGPFAVAVLDETQCAGGDVA